MKWIAISFFSAILLFAVFFAVSFDAIETEQDVIPVGFVR